jgi:hypothetical protein
MMRSNKHLVVGLALVGLATVAACSKQGAEPTAFGVNVTVDATGLTADERKAIITDKLTVVSDKAGDTPVIRMMSDLPKAIQGGTVKFHYEPGANITKNDKLTFELDVIGTGSKIIASGTSETVQLAANAVDAKIILSSSGGNDGGQNDGGNNSDANPGDIVNPNGKANGVACLTDDECGTGFCTDHVCCNERCDDVCVACNQAPSKGTCTPYAVNTDPELECAPKLPPATTDDGGTADASGEAGAAEGGVVADGGSADAPPVDAGPVLNTPDGGFMTMPKTCGGTCGGARACKFPGAETPCGTGFCNTSTQQAAFSCDGTGTCSPVLTQCQDYSCTPATGACGNATKGCSTPSDCLDSDYCTGGGKCMPKKGDSISCSLPSECQSGNCNGDTGAKVCCNTACDGMGQTCTEAGHVGQCQCMGVTCAAGVSCQVFYLDADHDGFGDPSGTIANGRAVAGCMGSPPTGFVADKTDCDDANSNAFPHQPMFFGSPRANGTYDYDCNGSDDKQTREYPNGTCQFCGGTANCAATTTSCTGTTATGSFQCPLESTNLILALSSDPGDTGLVSRAAAIGIQPIPRPIYGECCGCKADDKSGFTVVGGVKCGSYAYKHTCGTCNGSTENADTQVYTQQLCH